MNAFLSLAVPLARVVTPKRDKAGQRLRAALIPPALPGSMGDAASLSSSAAYLRMQGFDGVDLMFGGDWPLDAPIDRRINAERFFYGGSHLQFASLIPRLAAYSHAYFVGADIIDGAYNPRSVCGRLAVLGEIARLGGSSTILGSSLNAHPEATTLAALRALPPEVTICARDPISLERMEHFLDRPIKRVADVAFLLDPQPGHETVAEARAWIAERRKAGDRVIALNANDIHAQKHAGLPGALPILMSALLRHGVSILLVPHDVRPSSSDERLLADATAALTPAERDRVRMMRPESPGAIKAALADVDLLVTGRMHPAILGMSAGTPAFCFAYQGKFEGLFELFDLQSAGLLSTPEELISDPIGIAEQIHGHLENTVALGNQIRAHLPAVIKLAHQNFA